MIYRSHDIPEIVAAVSMYSDEIIGFHPSDWISDNRNIALTDGNGNYNLLEYEVPGVYTGHTFYRDRGKNAIRLLREALKTAFTDYPVEIIRGLTPIKLIGARWMARQGGFKSYGVVQTSTGPCELFILSKHEYLGTK